MRFDDILPLFERLWDAWLEHPEFEAYYTEPWLDGRYSPELDLFSVMVRMMFEHEPGIGGETRSWTVCCIEDANPNMVKRGERRLGKFVGLESIEPDDPVSAIYPLLISHSYKGANRAFYARMALKDLLPRDLKPWVSKARSGNNWPKYQLLRQNYLSMETWQEIVVRCKGDMRQLRSQCEDLVPEWYWSKSKGELWIETQMSESVKARLGQWIAPMDFWRCATGQVHPEEVTQYVTHQPRLIE